MKDAELELAILQRYVEHHNSVGTGARKCARELDMREVITSVTGAPADDEIVKFWHARLAPPKPHREGVLRPCSSSSVNTGSHRFHARAFYEPGKAPAWDRISELQKELAGRLPAEKEKEVQDQKASSKTKEDKAMPDPRKVFVVHGRDSHLRNDFFSFLRALGLQPIEWVEALKLTGKATPYIGEALDKAFKNAQAVIVLLSPDDEVRLSPELWDVNEDEEEKNFRLQARPNVLFEAGMAFGTQPDRTVLVEVGKTKAFSDVGGRHVVRLSNSPENRNDIAERLKTAGCDVSKSGSDWLKTGDFTVVREKKNDSFGYDETELNEGDIVALLDDWWPKSGESVPDSVRVNFSEVDRLLSLPLGSTRKYISQVASRRSFQCVSSGKVVAVYEYQPDIEAFGTYSPPDYS